MIDTSLKAEALVFHECPECVAKGCPEGEDILCDSCIQNRGAIQKLLELSIKDIEEKARLKKQLSSARVIINEMQNLI